MNSFEHVFRCPLPNGLHARPASQLAEVAGRFAAEITLVKDVGGVEANAKSILSIVAAAVRSGDPCRLRISGEDAEAARAALVAFIADVLPGCDEALPTASSGKTAVLPRSLPKAGIRWYAGRAACRGIGCGAVVTAGGLSLPKELADEPAVSGGKERQKVEAAVAALRSKLEGRLSSCGASAERGILQAHASIVNDPALAEKAAELMSAGSSAGQAIIRTAEFFAARLKASESALVRERAADVEDVCLQLLEHIYGGRFKQASIELGGPSVVVAENLTPRQLLAMDRDLLKGLVLEDAGETSHVVVLARSFGIPTLIGVTEARTTLPAGQEAVVDGNLGIVILPVNAAVKRYYDRENRKSIRRREHFERYLHSPAVTGDGQRLEVAANVATAEEIAPSFAQGADGIGLFRTEMLFMDRDQAPSEEEQFAVYVQAARAAEKGPVIIRTVDIGGDKPLPYMRLPRESNPFLGYRGVRIYAEHQDLFDAQMRAIMRASAFGKIWVMAPMVSMLEEVRWIKTRIAAIRGELKAEGRVFDATMPVGVMIEVPSAAFIMDQLAEEVDFFSIGTNDLVQYFLAADRGNEKTTAVYSALHPAFLRLLAKIVEEARRRNRWIGMCGEMARDSRNLPLLVGLGLNEISTAAPEIPNLKATIARLSAAECRTALDRALACRGVAEVEDALSKFQGSAVVRGLLDAELITVGSDSLNKEEAIREIVDGFHVTGRTDQPEAVEEAVWAREAVYSTGLGHGFAIPHCKTDAVAANSLGVLRLAQPIDWQSVDGKPVQFVILLAIRESDNNDAHMKVLAKLARKLMHEDFRERLLVAADREAITRRLNEELGI